MPRDFSEAELEAYLDEALTSDEMSDIEAALRADPQLTRRLAAINGRRDAGLHTLGEIWRRHRASCPSREQLGSYLLGAVHNDVADYIDFHLKTVGCRFCQAGLADLKSRHEESQETVDMRRRKYYDSSAGYLNRGE
ncbi:MAG: hypothetical protein RIC55_18235 [Pirellulaceae bacterium]